MLTLSPNLYSAGLRPSLRAMSDNIFGGDVWSHHKSSLPSPVPLPAPIPQVAMSRRGHSHSRSSSYSSIQSSLSTRALLMGTDLHIPSTMSPTLALARHAFSPTSSISSHTRSSSVSSVEAVNWPSKGIEYVRSTVSLSSPRRRPRSLPKANKRTPEASPERTKGLQPLLLQSKATRAKAPVPKTPASAPLPKTTEPKTPTGLRPLLLADKARPARSSEKRARDKMGMHGRSRSTWHAEPNSLSRPAVAHLSFRERARRTIASIAEIDW